MHKKLKQIEYFYNILKQDNENVVIGGSYSLMLHGLKIHKEPEDIDIIIYSPTKKQLKYIGHLSLLTEPSNFNEYSRRSYKIKFKTLIIDVLVEHTTETPNNLLTFVYDKTNFKIQNITNVFEAQKKYVTKIGLRTKDYEKSLKLKELNFNLI